MNIQTHFITHTGKLKARGGEVRWRAKSVKHMLSNH